MSDTEDKWEFTRDLKHRIAALYGYPQEVVRRLASEVIILNLRSIFNGIFEIIHSILARI